MKKNKLKKNFKKAFTLVELIIVIAVIAILAVFLVPNFSNVLGDTNATNVKNDTASIKNIVMAYISEVGAVPVANISATTGNVISITEGSKTYYPGVSTAMFQHEAAGKGKYYVIDMDLLTKPQINVEDKVSKTSPKLGSLPATSAIADVKTNAESGSDTSRFETAKKIKNTSVTYVIDENLNVYAAYSKDIKKGSKASSVIDGSDKWVILSDSISEEEAKMKQDTTFKTIVTSVGAGTILSGIDVDDSNYN